MNPSPAHLKFLAPGLCGPCAATDAVAGFEEEDGGVCRLGEIAGGDETCETGAEDDYVVGGCEGGSAGDDGGGGEADDVAFSGFRHVAR